MSSLAFEDQEKKVDDVGIVRTTEVNEVEPAMSPEDDARIRRKIDCRLMPLLCTIYGLQFLDKTCMSYASIMGFRQDAGLTLDNYSWLSSIFYLGYLVGEYPMSLTLQRYPVAKVTSVMIVLWGTILTLISVGRNFTGLMILRFFLGFFESAITPALTLFTAQYYKRSEQGTRTGIWFSFNASGAIVGSLLAFGLYTADHENKLAIAGWKLIFIILGLVTVAVGVLFALFVPDSPDKARFFTPKERLMAVERIRGNQQGVIDHTFRAEQVKEALKDPFTWMYVSVSLLASIPNGGYTNFSSILVAGFGFTTSQSLLLGMATSWLAIAVIFFLWLGDKTKRRALVTIIPCLISMVGAVLVWTLPSSQRVARLIGFYLTSTFVVALTAVLSLITSNVAGQTKKSTVMAIYLIAYCVGNLIGPQTFRSADAPRYSPALATVVACDIVIVFIMAGLHVTYQRENKRRDATVTDEQLADMSGHEFDDITDRKNPAFRYTL